jgi:alpha-beta hydrolase superfamily lysophospholipase
MPVLTLLSLLAFPALAKPVSFKTADGWTIAGEFRAAAKSRGAVLLVHGAQAGKGEWEALSAELRKRGWSTLAIDLRGHGGSVAGPRGRTTFERFGEAEWSRMDQDLEAALDFLNKKSYPDSKVGLLGGSVGANLCARVGALRRPAFTVLLSPGATYIGIALELPQGRILAAASPQDRYAWDTIQGFRADQADLLNASAGHGAQMLASPAFTRSLLEWIGR